MQAVIREMPKRWLEERRASGASKWDEMWSGVLHMAPMPNVHHQRFLRDLTNLLQRRWAQPQGGEALPDVNLTTPEDEADWTSNFRAPDILLLSADRLLFLRDEYVVGPPLVCIEICSPNDESYEKLPFYAGLGVPEVWIIDCDTKKPEVFVLSDGAYKTRPTEDGWTRSEAVGLRMKGADGKLVVIFDGDATPAVVPE